jgi:phenylacetate-CoA ligase
MKESVLSLILGNRRAIKGGTTAIQERQRARLRDSVAFARAHSPYYRELYRALPEGVDEVSWLPVTSKAQLMARFDDWATDRSVTLKQAQAFVGDSSLIGERFLGKYTVATTSGTTGERGIFVIDDRSLMVTNALAARMIGTWLGLADLLRIIGRGARMSMVMATGGHFASTVAAARLRKSPRRANRIQVLSAKTPLPELVADLNDFRPALLAPYASVAALLANEQEAGRLKINPVLLTLSAEGLPSGEYGRIARSFRAKVGNSYACTECTFLSYSCDQGWLHVNSDWLVLEAVDADHQPTPPGTASHTVLISNLANRVQPILRYDLGDSVVFRPDRCPCGNPLPAIQVRGRSADVLNFDNARGEKVSIPPVAFAADDVPGVELCQLLQTSTTGLRLHLRTAQGGKAGQIGQAVEAQIRGVLDKHGLNNVTVERADEPPEQSAGGKYRSIVPLATNRTSGKSPEIEGSPSSE